jgi:AcrR family transcriptional regulator
MLRSAIAVVSEYGYEGMSVARVTERAGVSRRTFYDLFEDREDCFLAAFEDIAGRMERLILASSHPGSSWREEIRSTLLQLLKFLDEEPEAGVLMVVDALKAGPRVLQRRVEILEQLSGAIHRGGSHARTGQELPPLTGEGIVGALLGVVHTRLLQADPGSMVELLNPLMGIVVLPYLRAGVAKRELRRLAPARHDPRRSDPVAQAVRNPLEGLPMRITHRTLLVLTVIDEHPGASNRKVADLAEITDQGQVSKLLSRLQKLDLIDNTGHGQPSGEPNAWRLTPRGQGVRQEIAVHADRVAPSTLTRTNRGVSPSTFEEEMVR